MLAWVFRHRHQLRALYGLPPEPRMAALMAAVETYGDGTDLFEPDPTPTLPAPEPRPAAALVGTHRGLPVIELHPARRRA